MQRSLGLPFNDPRLLEWTEADYLREFAFLELETEDVDTIANGDPTDLTAGTFDAQLQMAAEGRWEDLGLDSPEAPANPNFQPVSIDTFMSQ